MDQEPLEVDHSQRPENFRKRTGLQWGRKKVDQEALEVNQEPLEVDQTVDQEPLEVDQEPPEVDQEPLCCLVVVVVGLVVGVVVTYDLPMLTYDLPMLTYDLPMLTYDLPMLTYFCRNKQIWVDHKSSLLKSDDLWSTWCLFLQQQACFVHQKRWYMITFRQKQPLKYNISEVHLMCFKGIKGWRKMTKKYCLKKINDEQKRSKIVFCQRNQKKKENHQGFLETFCYSKEAFGSNKNKEWKR